MDAFRYERGSGRGRGGCVIMVKRRAVYHSSHESGTIPSPENEPNPILTLGFTAVFLLL